MTEEFKDMAYEDWSKEMAKLPPPMSTEELVDGLLKLKASLETGILIVSDPTSLV